MQKQNLIFLISIILLGTSQTFAKEEDCPSGQYDKGICVVPQDVAPTGTATNPIDCAGDKLSGVGCSVNINQLVGVSNKSGSRSDILSFTRDAVTGLTLFIGTLVLIALIYSGFLYVMAGGDEKMADKGKNGIKNSIIGLLLVILSYVIIKAVGYFATGNN